MSRAYKRKADATEETGGVKRGKPTEDATYPKPHHTDKNDWIKRQGVVLPLPVPEEKLIAAATPNPEEEKKKDEMKKRGLEQLEDDDPDDW